MYSSEHMHRFQHNNTKIMRKQGHKMPLKYATLLKLIPQILKSMKFQTNIEKLPFK